MKWTRDQLLAALNLYHRTPFGQQHSRHKPIIEMAHLIGRTPSAVAMKLSNFTALDPLEKARGIKGLESFSQADQEIWNEYAGRLNALAEDSEEALERFQGKTLPAPEVEVPPSVPAGLGGPTEILSTVKVRRQQSFFRRAVLASYNQRCCISGNPVPDLLRASHIVPWSKCEEHRTNPSNGLCLAATYDAAFDRGLLSLDADYRILLSSRLKSYLPDEELEKIFLLHEGQAIRLPEKNLPDLVLMERHRREVFVA
jgi:putative restriction endonuclease